DACDWTQVYDTGASHFVTALAVSGDVTYAGWCGINPCNPSSLSTTGEGFVSGIATNAGGTWHEVDTEANDLPNRFVTGLSAAPSASGSVGGDRGRRRDQRRRRRPRVDRRGLGRDRRGRTLLEVAPRGLGVRDLLRSRRVGLEVIAVDRLDDEEQVAEGIEQR